MQINWFPGHMTKSLREMEASLPLADIIIYVLDSRAPASCMNPEFDKLFVNKTVIYVLNKADLAPKSEVKAWMDILVRDGNAAVALNSTATNSTNILLTAVRNACSEKLNKYKAKGIRKSLRAMIVGVPNSGKSTLINNLAGSSKTVTGNRPGVTRGKQWVRVNEYFEVLDTPGTLYPKITNEKVGRHLVYIGSIKDEVTDTFELSLSLLEELNEIDNGILAERYKTEFKDTALDTLNEMARKRGYLIKGGEVDSERMAYAVLDDFRKGRLGTVILDNAKDYSGKK